MQYSDLAAIADIGTSLATLLSVASATVSAYRWGKASGFKDYPTSPIPEEVGGYVMLNGRDLGIEVEKLVRVREKTEAFLSDTKEASRLNRSGARWAMITAALTALTLTMSLTGRVSNNCAEGSQHFYCPIGAEYLGLTR